MKNKLLRFLALGIDSFIAICISLMVNIFILSILYLLNQMHLYESDFNLFPFLFFILYFFIIIFKDVWSSGSIGKNILHLRIVDDADETLKINIQKRILRNLGFILLPIDIIIFILCNKRIGEMITQTTVSKF